MNLTMQVGRSSVKGAVDHARQPVVDAWLERLLA
jgi:hypothetical protein